MATLGNQSNSDVQMQKACLCLAFTCAILMIPAGLSGIRKGMQEREQWKSSVCVVLNVTVVTDLWMTSIVRVQSTGIVIGAFKEQCVDKKCREDYLELYLNRRVPCVYNVDYPVDVRKTAPKTYNYELGIAAVVFLGIFFLICFGCYLQMTCLEKCARQVQPPYQNQVDC
jgi:hypothetical protein